ncbi:MAG: PKD domain-containing protein, partial [Flavobacteriales bacterium]|nr:PKD domain-containing protein [Flavobacteriales bacterium]
ANPLVGCPPLPVQFIQSTVGITQWTWEFGDGTQSTALDPQHIYFNAGTFQVEFWATNGCASDTMVQQVVVLPPP